MLTSIDVKFIFDSACLSASLGDKGLFSSANILQIVDAVRRVVFLPSCYVLANSSPNSSLVRRVKYSTVLYSLPKQVNLVPRSSRLTVQ